MTSSQRLPQKDVTSGLGCENCHTIIELNIWTPFGPTGDNVLLIIQGYIAIAMLHSGH